MRVIPFHGAIAMLRELQQSLSGVRQRQRWMRTLDCFVVGALVGAVAGVGIEVARVLNIPIHWSAGWLCVLACSTFSGLISVLAPVRWLSSARMVDSHYRLQDRAVTALEFAKKRDGSDPLVRLQVADALERMQKTVAGEVVPMKTPRFAPSTMALCAVMLGLSFVPRGVPSTDVGTNEIRQIVNEQAETLEETMLEEVRELVDKNPEPELKELQKELEEMVAEMKSPQIDQREALAKLSEMQQSLAAALEKFDLHKTDAQLQEFAAALEPAESMQAVAEALKAGEYDKAAEELEKVDAEKLGRKERDAVSANLKKFRKDLGEANEGQLSEGAKEMQEGLENENPSQCKNGQCKAAAVCKNQGLKKSISQCLNCQLNRLSECKGNCQGQCNSDGPARKSQNPSNKAGKAASGQPLGEEKTQLNSSRHQENLTGVQGDGPSERETSTSPEGEQDAKVGYSKRYSEYRKQMEEVLDSEPLPLGHRETVRKYFESIRPTEEIAK